MEIYTPPEYPIFANSTPSYLTNTCVNPSFIFNISNKGQSIPPKYPRNYLMKKGENVRHRLCHWRGKQGGGRKRVVASRCQITATCWRFPLLGQSLDKWDESLCEVWNSPTHEIGFRLLKILPNRNAFSLLSVGPRFHFDERAVH